MKDTVILDK